MEFIIDLQREPLTTTFIQRLLVHLHRFDYALLDDLSWKMNPRLHDEIMLNTVYFTIPLSRPAIGMEIKPHDMYTVYTFAGREMQRSFDIEEHTILLFHKEKLLLRIVNVGWTQSRASCQCGAPFHYPKNGYWGYHCVCSNYHDHNPLCKMHNEKNKLERF